MSDTNMPNPSNRYCFNLKRAIDNSYGFEDADFPLQSYPEGIICSLQNENLFSVIRMPARPSKVKNPNDTLHRFRCIEPALLLASRILLDCWPTFRPYIRRKVSPDDSSALSETEVLIAIRKVIPIIEFIAGKFQKGSMMGSTDTLYGPRSKTDRLLIDYAFVGVLMSPNALHSQKLAALVYIAVLICNGMAHILEYRTIFGGRNQLNLRVLTSKAGEAWEEEAFGGMVKPMCIENNKRRMRGLMIHYGWEIMNVDCQHIRKLMTEQHWGLSDGWVEALHPPLTTFSRVPALGGEAWWRVYEEQLATDIKGYIERSMNAGILAEADFTPENWEHTEKMVWKAR